MLLLGGFLGVSLAGKCWADSNWDSVPTLESRSWLLTLPWPSPTLRTIGVGGGTWRSPKSGEAAQAAATAALLKAGGVLVQFRRVALATGLDSQLSLETQLTPTGQHPEPFGGCEATLWEAAYNLTWCVGGPQLRERDFREGRPQWPPMPPSWFRPDAQQRPDWMNSVPILPGWRHAVGAAGRTVIPSEQLPLAEKRGLEALAEQTEVHLHSSIIHGRPAAASAKRSHASGQILLEGARTVSVWRNVDGMLYILVAARIGEHTAALP